MGNFIGGSAYAMARDVAEGLLLLNANVLKKFTVAELKQLAFELDKVQKEARADQPAVDDTQAIQKRGRKLSRITAALNMINQVMVSRNR
jgi:butyrate kinase